MNRQQTILGVILRVIGFFSMLAIGAVVMPFSWIQQIHQCLRMGEMAEGPIVEYLVRSLSLGYAMVGVIFWYLSFRVPQHWDFIRLLAVLCVVSGVGLLCVDLSSGMPGPWTLLEGPPAIVVGLWMLYLHHQGSRASEQSEAT